MKKQLPTDVISSELAQSSVFFQKVAEQSSDREQALSQDQPSKPHSFPPPEPSHSPTAPVREEQPKTNYQPLNEGSKQNISTDVMIDVMTSVHHDISLKAWQEVIENTETQNSALRLTSEERYAVEDAVSELRRKYGIKTSMNEVARLGLLLLIADFKKNKKESTIHKVKKA